MSITDGKAALIPAVGALSPARSHARRRTAFRAAPMAVPTASTSPARPTAGTSPDSTPTAGYNPVLFTTKAPPAGYART